MRSSIFGGFNRKDVVGYIEILYRRIHDLEEENRKLKEGTAVPETEGSQAPPEPVTEPVAQAAPEPVAEPVIETVPEPVKPKKIVRVKRAGR